MSTPAPTDADILTVVKEILDGIAARNPLKVTMNRHTRHWTWFCRECPEACSHEQLDPGDAADAARQHRILCTREYAA